jgi:LCP family protein required for cell wall assembly
MKKNLKFVLSTINKLIYAALLIISVWFIYKIIKMNIIPNKYLTIGLLIYGVILIALGLLVIFKKVHFIFKILSNIISILLIALLLFVNNYIVNTDNFMDKIKQKDYSLISYYVVSLSDNEDSKVSDFNSVGIYSSDENYEDALKQLTDEYNISTNKYNDFEEANKALFNGDEDIILLSSFERSLLIDTINNYENDTVILATYYVKVQNETETVDFNLTEQPFNIFISGIDVSGDISTVSRSDVNMVVTINPKTHDILLTSIPRDYYVTLYGKNAKDKLTHAGIYGINTSVKTVENLLDIDIQYNIKVNFSTVINLVDLLGGIDINSDASFTAHTNKNCHINKGNNHLDGKCALAYSRERYAYTEGDRHRVKNQQDVLTAIINKLTSSKELLTKYSKILDTLSESFQTNISKEGIYKLINMQLNDMPSWKISNYSLDGTNSYDYTYSYSGGKLYVMIPDMDTVNTAKTKINEILNN